ncbi:MAG: methyl-accepting chemotaxis protein [Syntrophothermus sp.]
MSWFLNLSTKVKLYLSFGIILIFTIMLFIFLSGSINKIRENQIVFASKDYVITTSAVEFRSNLNRQRAQVLEMMLQKDRKIQEDIRREIEERRDLMNDILDKLTRASKGDEFLENTVGALAKMTKQYDNGREEEIKLILTGNSNTALAMGSSELKKYYEDMRVLALRLDEHSNVEVRNNLSSTEELVNSTIRYFASFSILILIFIIVTVIYLNRMIAKPLTQITQIAGMVAKGDLSVNVPKVDRKDEVGTLWQTFGEMVLSLKEFAALANRVANNDLKAKAIPKSDKDVLAISLNLMVDSLNGFASRLVETINVLGSSSTQILSGTTQLAANASETASAIGETTSTIEEVRRTSEQSNSKSKEVLEISQRATDFSEAGKQSTEETINGINKIGRQMEIIADSIIRLTEQSRAIAEIISTVNDLAEQSNLLSVNASIEAARAGEHGKAFGIVAQEIKSLAEQSKQATAQVKAVLNDIQNAINSAVLATEQGEKIVEDGTKLAEQSENAISNLAETVSVAKDSAIQTSVITQEQLVGMSQIAMAMENIKAASIQSVTTTKDLESSARSLQQMSSKLKESVSVFKF